MKLWPRVWFLVFFLTHGVVLIILSFTFYLTEIAHFGHNLSSQCLRVVLKN